MATNSVGVQRASRTIFLALLCVFVLVDNLLFRHMEDATLRDGQAADIAPGISQEVPFRHLPGDVYVPPAVHLSKDEIVELLRQRRLAQQSIAMRLPELGADGKAPQRHDLLMVKLQ
jgi:hypothetical protein